MTKVPTTQNGTTDAPPTPGAREPVLRTGCYGIKQPTAVVDAGERWLRAELRLAQERRYR